MNTNLLTTSVANNASLRERLVRLESASQDVVGDIVTQVTNEKSEPS